MDKLTKERRSWNMSRVQAKNTKPEITVRSLLHRKGYRFRIHRGGMPGKPDIVLPKYQTVIFVHGCFWHGHDNCKKSRIPNTNSSFWQTKILTNKCHDQKTLRDLEKKGWRIALVWECALSNTTMINNMILALDNWIKSDEYYLELASYSVKGDTK